MFKTDLLVFCHTELVEVELAEVELAEVELAEVKCYAELAEVGLLKHKKSPS